ncbi:LLM class flavin-dependent oxidoreductase [Nocardia caishijiensis]|uniref:Alkanesulfonate monooxygenase SsuD/methylene tetrahydromethanopterin reductase-like flavin-dependent oxidoreductase (Luciferase family) n=1 Tax=Nocardia caishijiensis TaxID=184756 RepID=A0ABQ6YGB7_9NOCA|nr:LLM class flavin-dependent oxidoreductase [Nocardia caishijiensis]KAF0844844.1 alkanesulfonate monooxygenase SsuD/methylene tetrahydromethanopterin reductase-like flavin-dependent oxidoreductase (luciferase family) [Nocardia caishijiensis]
MHIGLGLPIADPGTLPEWAVRAEAAGFASLGLLDRLVYDNPEPLVTLAMLAGRTEHIRLQTEVLLAPLREPTLLAKQTATLDRISGGRFVLGLGVGGRDDDHEASGTDIGTRGRRLDEQLGLLRRLWSGDPFSDTCGPIGPAPTTEGGPELLFGGFRPAAIDRVGRWGGGFLAAAAPSWAGGLFEMARESWSGHGRSGSPRIVAQLNTVLGPQHLVDQARAAVLDYYEFSGRAEYMADTMLTTPREIASAIRQFDDLGASEVMLYCYGTDPTQIDRLADIVL